MAIQSFKCKNSIAAKVLRDRVAAEFPEAVVSQAGKMVKVQVEGFSREAIRAVDEARDFVMEDRQRRLSLVRADEPERMP